MSAEPSVGASSHQVAQFERDGFLHVPCILSAAEVDHFGNLIDAEVARRTADDRRELDEKTRYEQSFVQCMRLWETEPAIAPLTFLPKLAAMAAALLQTDCVRLWQDQALYKEPGGRETTPHQDLTFWPLGNAPLVSAWIPFDNVTIPNGAMAYVPGSHRAGRLRVVDITHRSSPYDILNDPALGGREPVWVEPAAGDVVWHHGLTVHHASANQSAATRRVFTIVYLADGARRDQPWPTFPLDRAGVAVGELVQGEGMPVVWPTPAQLPAAPTHIGGATGPQHGTANRR